MFTQAGYNWRRRSICKAIVSRHDRPWRRPATLVRFYDNVRRRYTDYAWDGGSDRLSWGEQVAICNLIHVPGCGYYSEFRRSRLA